MLHGYGFLFSIRAVIMLHLNHGVSDGWEFNIALKTCLSFQEERLQGIQVDYLNSEQFDTFNTKSCCYGMLIKRSLKHYLISVLLSLSGT